MYIAIFFSVLTLIGLYKMLTNAKDVVRISSRGIQNRGKLTPWTDVLEIRAARGSFSSNVSIRVATHELMGGIILQGQRLLTPAEYAVLAARLRTEVAPRYPQLKVS